eukprot:14029319-Alexandrium_andersonii.AAC.1
MCLPALLFVCLAAAALAPMVCPSTRLLALWRSCVRVRVCERAGKESVSAGVRLRAREPVRACARVCV